MKKSVQKQALLAAFLGCTFLFGIKSTVLANASTTVDNFFTSMESKADSLGSKQYYNVGYIKTTYSNTNPGTIYGGTWVLIGQGKSLLGMDSGYSVRDIGGEKQVLLTTDTIPSHTHTGTTGTGGSHGHSFVARSGMPNPSNSCHHTFTFMTTETNQGLVSNAGGPMLKEGYASIANGGGHNHTLSTNSTGGSLAHNNMQPYVTVYYWEKTSNATVTVQNSTGTSQQKLIGLTKRLNAIKEGSSYHKVGDIISLTSSYDPNNTAGFGGTWVRTAKGRTLVGVDEKDADFSTVKTYAGEKTHILTSDEMPSHTHNGSTSTRGAHNHAYNKSGANLYGTAFHTNSGNKLYSNNPPDGNSSGLHEQELYTEAGTAGAHGHNFTTDATGSGQGHSNLMPYYTVFMWEKISDLAGAKRYYTVTFKDGHTGSILKTEQVEDYKDATPPIPNTYEDYEFIGWDNSYTTIYKDTIITAQYKCTKEYHVTLNGMTWIYNTNSSIDVGVAYESDDPNIQFIWKFYDLNTSTWYLISPTYSSSNWASWFPAAGSYWLHVEARTSDGQTATQTTGFNVTDNTHLRKGWVKFSDGTWHYYKSSGGVQIGWLSDGGYWYYLDASNNGAMRIGWKYIEGDAWYYFDSSGHMKTGWVQVGGYYYYMNTNGKMLVGWQKIGDYWYYLETDSSKTLGHMYTNCTANINGTNYTFDSNGHWLEGV